MPGKEVAGNAAIKAAENALQNGVQWLRLGVEAIGAAIVVLGICVALFAFVRGIITRKGGDFTVIRLILARYLTLALEFQLGADLLSTAVAPTWDAIGRLAAVAAIRTALNFFLSREMREERETTQSEREAVARGKQEAA